MAPKTNETTYPPQNDREGTGESTDTATDAHSHRHSYQRPKRQAVPQETLIRLRKLRYQYKDKIIERRSYESATWVYFEYDVYPDEYYEKELEILCGDRTPEQAADYLESFPRYSPWLLKRLDSVRAFQYLKVLGDMPESREYAERVIAENPGTPIELEARFYIADTLLAHERFDDAERAEAYRQILEIAPNAINALSGLGRALVDDDKPAEAIPYFKQVNRLNPKAGYWGLGESYEKLGDVKTAWIYYKKALRSLTYHSPMAVGIRLHIEHIEAGNPIYKPVPQVQSSIPIGADEHEVSSDSPMPIGQTAHTEVLPDTSSHLEIESRSLLDMRDENAERSRAATEAARQAHAAFVQHQVLSQKEIDDFLQWAETIMNAESPMNTNNFLMKEMEAHLKGGQAQFDPERIVRAFEIMERYGATEGIKHLQKADADVAKQVQRLLTEKRQPHQNPPQRRNK